jgi:hypothetical protein
MHQLAGGAGTAAALSALAESAWIPAAATPNARDRPITPQRRSHALNGLLDFLALKNTPDSLGDDTRSARELSYTIANNRRELHHPLAQCNAFLYVVLNTTDIGVQLLV